VTVFFCISNIPFISLNIFLIQSSYLNINSIIAVLLTAALTDNSDKKYGCYTKGYVADDKTNYRIDNTYTSNYRQNLVGISPDQDK
jgi:hypothetical protein